MALQPGSLKNVPLQCAELSPAALPRLRESATLCVCGELCRYQGGSLCLDIRCMFRRRYPWALPSGRTDDYPVHLPSRPLGIGSSRPPQAVTSGGNTFSLRDFRKLPLWSASVGSWAERYFATPVRTCRIVEGAQGRSAGGIKATRAQPTGLAGRGVRVGSGGSQRPGAQVAPAPVRAPALRCGRMSSRKTAVARKTSA